MSDIWSRSIREEIIAALWLIAGLLAWQNEIRWLAWLLFVKAAFDVLFGLVFAILEIVKCHIERPEEAQ